MVEISSRMKRLAQLFNPIRVFRDSWRRFGNWRRLRNKNLDYVLMSLPASLPALPESRNFIQRRLFGPAPLSLWELEKQFDRIAADPRPNGVILTLAGLQMSLADLQTLRGIMLRLREKGKRLIVHSQLYDTAQYYLASAADEVLLQPNGDFFVNGLLAEAYFLKDALAQVGVSMDVIAISPFKGAFDQLSRSEISPEGRAQIEWLLDSRFEQITGAIADNRRISREDVGAMIDGAPHQDTVALSKGYVDGLVYEEDLPAHLNVKHIVEWDSAKRKLIKLPRPAHSNKAVALLRVSGLMVPGEGNFPPADLPIPVPVPILGEEQAGDLTVVQQVRSLMQQEWVSAVVLFIDSGGGAVSAGANMSAALDSLAEKVPLVVYMNGVAASGGYWIAANARWIVAQPGTITGSIGVVTAKPVAGGLLEKAQVKATRFKRGANADLFDLTEPFNDAQRAQVRESIEHVYQRFIERVASGRKLTVEAVDEIGGGRVWTGEQALANGLVDELGDLKLAIRKARELASLPANAPVYFWEGGDEPLPPQPKETVKQAARMVNPFSSLNTIRANARVIASGRALALLPFRLK
jgi:protease-4